MRTAGEPRFLLCFCPGPRDGPGVLARDTGEGSGSAVRRVAARSSGGCSSPPGPEGCAATAARPAAATAAAAAAASAAGVLCGVRAPLARATRLGGTATGGSLLDLHPSCFLAPSFLRLPWLGRAWGGGDRLEGVHPGGAAEGKSKDGRRQGRAHTLLPWHRPPLCGWALASRAAARSRGVGDRTGFLGIQRPASAKSKGEKFICPLGGRERFN